MSCEKNSAAIGCELICNTPINDEIFKLDFVWPGAAPKAGQFFMVKPKRSAVFLPRPISLANWAGKNSTVSFLIARKGKGTIELASMHSGEEAELIGPLGNAWSDFLPASRKPESKLIALVSGGVGIAPLNALLCEAPEYGFFVHAGFRNGFKDFDEKTALLGAAYLNTENFILATENGKDVKTNAAQHKGRITDFLEPENFEAVCACGPEPMLRAVAKKCKVAGVPCYVSLERRMACGVGACLGCTVATAKGNRRCCADGPVFPAEELFF